MRCTSRMGVVTRMSKREDEENVFSFALAFVSTQMRNSFPFASFRASLVLSNRLDVAIEVDVSEFSHLTTIAQTMNVLSRTGKSAEPALASGRQ